MRRLVHISLELIRLPSGRLPTGFRIGRLVFRLLDLRINVNRWRTSRRIIYLVPAVSLVPAARKAFDLSACFVGLPSTTLPFPLLTEIRTLLWSVVVGGDGVGV